MGVGQVEEKENRGSENVDGDGSGRTAAHAPISWGEKFQEPGSRTGISCFWLKDEKVRKRGEDRRAAGGALLNNKRCKESDPCGNKPSARPFWTRKTPAGRDGRKKQGRRLIRGEKSQQHPTRSERTRRRLRPRRREKRLVQNGEKKKKGTREK